MYRELKPYALFPLDEYFSGHQETANCWTHPKVVEIRPRSLHKLLGVPVRKAA